MTSKKKMKLSYYRILKPGRYLSSHLRQLTPRSFTAEWDPRGRMGSPGQSTLQWTLLALASNTHTHTLVIAVVSYRGSDFQES